jgi:hypothetical protein
MKYLLTTLAVLVTYGLTFSQTLQYHPPHEKGAHTNVEAHRVVNQYPDSVRIELADRNVLIVLQARNFNHVLAMVPKLSYVLSDIAKKVATSAAFSKGASAKIHVSVGRNSFQKIEVQPNQIGTTQVLSKDDQVIQLLPPGIEISIDDPLHKIYVYTESLTNLETLTQSDFQSIHTKLLESTSTISGRKSVKSRFIVRNREVEFNEVKFYQPLDVMFLASSAGLGVLRNTVYPELTGTFGVIFSDRFNRPNHRLELSYSGMYFSNRNIEGKHISNISSFLSLSYSKNFGDDSARPHWTGLGAGLLVQKAGDFNFFEGKTMKLFLITDMGSSKLSLIPEFYLTEDFKKFQFGLKLHYRF